MIFLGARETLGTGENLSRKLQGLPKIMAIPEMV